MCRVGSGNLPKYLFVYMLQNANGSLLLPLCLYVCRLRRHISSLEKYTTIEEIVPLVILMLCLVFGFIHTKHMETFDLLTFNNI